MTGPAPIIATAVFLDRLVRSIDPHQPPNEEQLALQNGAGRNLALLRLNRSLTIGHLAAAADVAPETIVLLEAGLADEALLPDEALNRLAAALASGTGLLGSVTQLLALASGRPETSSASTAAAATGEDDPMRQLEKNDVAFFILETLAGSHAGETADEVWERVRSQWGFLKPSFPVVAGVLSQLAEIHWIEVAGMRIERHTDTPAAGVYHITNKGLEVYQNERRRRQDNGRGRLKTQIYPTSG